MVWNHHDMKSCFADSQNKSSVAQLASASDCYTSGYQEVGSSSLPGGGFFFAHRVDITGGQNIITRSVTPMPYRANNFCYTFG